MADFPDLENVDVYRYRNTLDYDRWAPTTRIKMCNVPWCSDYDNVVRFADEGARDAYIDALTGEVQSFDTMFHVKPDGSAKVPVPITSAQGYNYLVVDLPRPTSDAQPLAYADGTRKGRYLYFITDARQLSPNTTLLTLALDVWQTYIYDMRFDYVMLERGHAPVAANTVDAYLANPRDNSAYLLTADIGGDKSPYIAKRTEVKNYSAEEQRACIVTYADLQGNMGSAAAPLVPALNAPVTSGALAPRVYTVAISALEGFLRSMESNAPWLKPSIRGIFFAPANLLTESGDFALWGVNIKIATATQSVTPFIKPGIADFAYPANAEKFAKLYTWPYAAIRLTDENGNASTVRVEDLGASGIEVASALNLVAPFVRLDARLLGIAGANDSLTFTTLENRTFSYGGAWGDYLKSWDVPIMEVSQSAASAATYNSVYQRAHAKLAANNSLASALASNETAQTNAGNVAGNITALNNINVNANTTVTENANNAALSGSSAANTKLSADCQSDNAASTALTGLQNDVIALTTANNAATTAGRSIASVVTSGLTGGAGEAGAAAITGIADMAVSFPSANAAAAISQSNNANAAGIAQSNALEKTLHAAQFTTKTYGIQANVATANTSVRNNASTACASANAGLTSTNAANTKTTADANANRAYATAIDAISANLEQAGVNAPATFGAASNLANLATAPRALFAQVVTQRACDIENAASNFARYGYALMREWSMDDMQVMKHFTYWKCAEVWCSGTGNALEGAQAAIKDILIAGTTVWSEPDKIGRVSVYDNFVD